MSAAVCDASAFCQLRSLVSGPLGGLQQLAGIERFVRAAVLHDEMFMLLSPLCFEPEAENEHDWSEEELCAGKRAVIVAMGPTTNGYDFLKERPCSPEPPENPEVLRTRADRSGVGVLQC